jgi:hypothetical protein
MVEPHKPQDKFSSTDEGGKGVLHKTLSHSMQIKKKLIDKNAIKVIKHKIAYPSLRFYPQSMPPPSPPSPPIDFQFSKGCTYVF